MSADREQKIPRYLQVYQMLKKKIEEGDYEPGQKLPSKRVLAEVCGCSLSTAENALSLLEEEGYIRMEERRGAFVESLPQQAHPTEFSLHLLEDEAAPGRIPEKDSLFPAALWAGTIRQVLSEDPQAILVRSPSSGSSRLRNALARFLVQTRGMKVQPEQIIIGSGTTSLYDTLIRMFSESMSVALERPGYDLIEKLYREKEIPVYPLPLKEDGLDLQDLQNCPAQFLHVTPYSSYPTQVSTSLERRKDYLDWIASRSGYLIEDDIYSEFMQGSQPLAGLYSMDRKEKVIYLNTFSGSMFPSLRMGYMILPAHLLDLYEEKAGMLPNSVPMLEQLAMAEFISSGSYEKLLNRRRHRARMLRRQESRNCRESCCGKEMKP